MLIDTHCHLNFEDFENRLDSIVKRAKENDVFNMVIIGIDGVSNKKAIDLANHYNFVASVGIHPSNVDDHSFDEVLKYVDNDKVVAIGETGIDLYWRTDNLERQIAMFRLHIELAIQKKLPLIIHMRNSFDEIYRVLQEYEGQVEGVFHCFNLSNIEATKIIDLGFYLGIGGVLTYKNAQDLQRAVTLVPRDKLILETDSPYLPPTPHRGKQNEPSYMKYVAEKLADLLEISYEEVKIITTANVEKLFKIGDRK